MAYNFVKANSKYLLVDDNSALDITGAITLACWVKRSTDLTTEQQLISKYENSAGKPNQRSYLMAINTSGNLLSRFAINGTTSGIAGSNSVGTISTSWTHAAATWTPNVINAKTYINGVDDSSGVGGITNSAIHSGTANLTIGANSSGAGSYYTGDMAEVGIWDVSLSNSEIASLADGFACSMVRPQNLRFYAPLVRNLQDVRGGLTITNNNSATVANHPRVYA